MNKKMIITSLACALLLSRCTALKKQKQESAVRAVAMSSHKLADSTKYHTGHRKAYHDSSQLQSFVELVPEGIVAFHPTHGFTGKATKIKVYQQQAKAITLSDTQSALWSSNQYALSQQQALRQSYTQTTSAKRTGAQWWWVAGACLIIVIAWWRYKK